jgi:hypothetical protein
MKTVKKEKQIGFENGKIDAKNRDHPLVWDNIRKAKMPKDHCSPLIAAYWEGWIEGFNEKLPPELCITIAA